MRNGVNWDVGGALSARSKNEDFSVRSERQQAIGVTLGIGDTAEQNA